MLGVRLDPETERGLHRHAALTRRTKSDIARDAVREYLARHDIDTEFRRQVKLLNENQTVEDAGWLDARTNELFQMLDEKDGGYDWGPDGPPM